MLVATLTLLWIVVVCANRTGVITPNHLQLFLLNIAIALVEGG